MPYSYTLSAVIPASPAEIYQAWLDSIIHSEMTGGEANMSEEVGADVSAWDGYITGSNLELVAGERRWRAAQRVGVHEVPVIVRPLADSEALEIALVENIQREDLAPLEEAEAYSRLMEEFGRTQASLAEAVGKSRSHVANTLRLLSLPAPVRRRLDEGELSAGHARALLAATDPVALAAEVVRRGLNVRATERLVQRRAEMPRPTRRLRDADTVAVERDLGALLGLRVTLEPKKRGGALTLHYASLDQLDRVLSLLRAS